MPSSSASTRASLSLSYDSSGIEATQDDAREREAVSLGARVLPDYQHARWTCPRGPGRVPVGDNDDAGSCPLGRAVDCDGGAVEDERGHDSVHPNAAGLGAELGPGA